MTREYVQRLGRVLRKGKDPSKLALLYEVIAEDTSEENTARRRQPKRKTRQLSLVPERYTEGDMPIPRAAENNSNWPKKPDF